MKFLSRFSLLKTETPLQRQLYRPCLFCLWPFKTSIWFMFGSPNVIFLYSRGGGHPKRISDEKEVSSYSTGATRQIQPSFPLPHKKNERTLNKKVWKGLTENWKMVNNWQLTNRLKFDWQLTFALDFTVNWQRAWLSFNYFLQNLFLRRFNSMIAIFSSDKVIKCAFIWELSGRRL